MNPSPPLHLFEGYGVELEYMIVRRDTLDVLPIADRLLHEVAGGAASDFDVNGVSWSNELVLHVVELKNTDPVPSLEPLSAMFQRELQRIDEVLKRFDAQLMPSAMHPWMNPANETRLWPHEYCEIYETYHRIFNCFRHGWANLQSVHLNLPFANEDEFARLHAAIRVLLPILPALAASSPICDGRVTGLMDTRLDVYRTNSDRVPSIAGNVIPEPIFRIDEYHEKIFERIFAEIAPHDEGGILQREFLNSRGAIARFDRGAIEIRVLDVQECPKADVAICAAVSSVLKELVVETWSEVRQQQVWDVAPLADILTNCIKDAEQTIITDREYLNLFGYCENTPATAQQLWRHLIDAVCAKDTEFARSWLEPLSVILESGPLARRIRHRIGNDASRERMATTYRDLCECLRTGTMLCVSSRTDL